MRNNRKIILIFLNNTLSNVSILKNKLGWKKVPLAEIGVDTN